MSDPGPDGPDVSRSVDVVVIGAGQAGLATGYHLRRAGLEPGRDFVLVDGAKQPGGAWPHMWAGLHLFSPSGYSSLPGWMMPTWTGGGTDSSRFPPRQHVVDYLTAYEERYRLAPLRPHRVTSVRPADDDPHGALRVEAPRLRLQARIVVSATGTWDQPFWPVYPGASDFTGRQLHTAQYRSPTDFRGQRVVVVGGGNSAAQILAEISTVAQTTWVTQREPRFLPDEVDGRALFDAATARVRATAAGQQHAGVGGLGDIVMVPEVRNARDRGVLKAVPMFSRLTPSGVAWDDGTHLEADSVVWCTGFRPSLRHLAALALRDDNGKIQVGGRSGTQSLADPRVYLVGYGDWVGAASATLIGVGRTARATVEDVGRQLSD